MLHQKDDCPIRMTPPPCWDLFHNYQSDPALCGIPPAMIHLSGSRRPLLNRYQLSGRINYGWRQSLLYVIHKGTAALLQRHITKLLLFLRSLVNCASVWLYLVLPVWFWVQINVERWKWERGISKPLRWRILWRSPQLVMGAKGLSCWL